MKKKLSKIGNSVVLRIPHWMCHHYDLKAGTEVQIWDNESPDRKHSVISFTAVAETTHAEYTDLRECIQRAVRDDHDKRNKLGAYATGPKRRPGNA